MRATGRATANQAAQEGAFPPRDMRSMANRFWGLLMGLVMPPRLLASAMPAKLELLSTCTELQ